MIDWNSIKYDDLKSMHFDSIDPEDSVSRRASYERVSVSYRATPEKLAGWAHDEEANIRELRKNILKYMNKKFENNSNVFLKASNECGMTESQIRKVINGERRPTIEFISFMCVGMQLSIEETTELFDLIGHTPFHKNNIFDSITFIALRDRDSIHVYLDQLREAGIKLHALGRK